jgi:hypothetical protein
VTTKDEALARIEAAFSGVPRPNNGELVHPESFDDMDLEPLYEIDSWRDMNDEALINSFAAPSFLSAAGFLYFLPAYMRFSLNNPDSPEAVVSAPQPSCSKSALIHGIPDRQRQLSFVA